jgi:hypothetical protein
MKRKRVLVFGASLCLITLLAFGYAHSRPSKIAPSGAATTKAIGVAQVPTPAVLNAFVARDIPVTLTGVTMIGGSATAGSAAALPRLQFRIAGKGVASARSVCLSLFEFNASGGLRRVDGWVRQVNLTDSRGIADLSLDLHRQLLPNTRLLLSVDRVHTNSQTWETPFLTLAQATRQAQAGNPNADARVERLDSPLPDLAGAALCSYAQGRAMLLARAGDRVGFNSFTCDQYERSYTITFANKQLP